MLRIRTEVHIEYVDVYVDPPLNDVLKLYRDRFVSSRNRMPRPALDPGSLRAHPMPRPSHALPHPAEGESLPLGRQFVPAGPVGRLAVDLRPRAILHHRFCARGWSSCPRLSYPPLGLGRYVSCVTQDGLRTRSFTRFPPADASSPILPGPGRGARSGGHTAARRPSRHGSMMRRHTALHGGCSVFLWGVSVGLCVASLPMGILLVTRSGARLADKSLGF